MIKNNNGVSLIELLIALAIVSIMMTGVYFTYISFTKTALDTRQVAKSESEVNQALLKLEKLLQSAGFGISNSETDVFVVDNSTVTFKTLFGDKIEAGLWEVCINGERTLTEGYPVVALDENKSNQDFISHNTSSCDTGNILYVCKSDDNQDCDDPYFYKKELSLSANESNTYEWSKNCAPNTHNLLINNDPYLGCLADFIVERTNDTVKLGIIHQKGNRKDSPLSKTYNYDSLSGSYTLDSEQEYYRWKKTEIVLDLVNLN
nr:prepilin-type N-terminal cleavage/methylation domain-containing protein [Flexistipes sinusarabici]